MKRLIPSLIFSALYLSAQVPTISNTDFPTFRTNLNTSLQAAASINGSYVNPGFITSLAFAKLSGVPLFARTDTGNTWTTGVQDFSAATHLRVPSVASYTPTVDGHIGYDATANAYKGFVGTVKTFAFLDSNITGTAANLSGTPALPNGATATTQTVGDVTAKLATDAFVGAAVAGSAGISGPVFCVSATGPCWHNSSGVLQAVTDAGSSAFAPIKVLRVDSPSGTPLEISGAEESSPTVVLGTVFVDSSAHLLQYKDATNTLAGTMVAPIADPGADHQWNKYIPNTGVPVRSRPACTDLSDSGTGCAGTLPLASNTNPLIAGTAAPGTGTTFSRTDHVHPTDTTRAAAATTVNGHALTGNVTVSAADVGLKWECQPGLGDGLNVIPSGTYLQTTCKNNTGVTVTITGIQCFTDNSGTSTLKVTNGAGVDLLTSPTNPLTCTSAYAAGTQSSTTTIANGDFLKFTFVADGSSKQTSWNIAGSR